MSGQRLFIWLILILLIAVIAKPKATWGAFNRAFGQRSRFVRVSSTVIIAYIIYGLYRYYALYWAP